MSLIPLKVGEPANDLLRLNRFWNKVNTDTAADDVALGAFRFARMWHSESTPGAGAMAIATTGVEPNARYPYYAAWRVSPAVGSESFEQSFILKSGTYDFIVTCATNVQGGIVQWSLDGGSIGSMDTYSASADNLVVMTISSVAVATSGLHSLSAVVNTKHASSIGYQAILYKYCLRESAA